MESWNHPVHARYVNNSDKIYYQSDNLKLSQQWEIDNWEVIYLKEYVLLTNESKILHYVLQKMSSRERKLSDQTSDGSVDPAKAPQFLTKQTSAIMGTNLLYSNSEESQQASVQSVRTTGEITALSDSNSLTVGPQLYELFIKHFDEGINIPEKLQFHIKHKNFTQIVQYTIT